MILVYALAIGLVVSILFAFTRQTRRFGMFGLLFVILVSGMVWVGHIPPA